MPTDPLELETRRRLYQHVHRNPGKYLRELQRDLDLAMGALEYHLAALESAGLVTVLADGNKRFFPAEMDRRDKRILAFLRQELPRRVLLVLLGQGTVPKSRLVELLGVAPSTLNYHLRHLVDVGLVEVTREGRDAVYVVHDSGAVVRLLVAHRASLLDRLVDAFLEGTDALR